ncbi:ATP-binding protein [Paracoccus sp. T5]|uniref:ATP-binding protein n=1 Tax=Paracoccus sp. T5 TaxID=3402161 RepID=UPI003ADE3410
MRQRFGLTLAGFILIVAACAGTVWMISADARRQIEKLASANLESVQWALAQSEVELLTMLDILGDIQQTPPPDQAAKLQQFRLRFDVFYSRNRTLNIGKVFEHVRLNGGVETALAEINDFLAYAVPLVDGSDAQLIAALPDLSARARALRPAVREISLEGVRTNSLHSDQQRGQVASALEDLALLVAALFLSLVAVVLALAFMARNARDQAKSIAVTHDRLRAVIATSIDAIVVADAHGRIIDFNEVAVRIYGYSLEEALGADMVSLIVPEPLRDEVRTQVEAMLDGTGWVDLSENPRPAEAMAMRKSGEVFPIEVSVARAESETGPVMVCFVRDISRRVANEAELIRARDRALAGEQAKADMLAVMSHEMRTPLNGLMGTLDLLMTTDLDDRQRRYAQVMAQSGQLLLRHVNNVLDISRADAGVIELVWRPFDPRQLVSQILDGLQAQAQQRGNVLSLAMIGDNRRPLLGDTVRLTQILMNLVGNAIKFTEGGHILVEIDRSVGAGHVEFRVTDTGIGIATEDQQRIFDEFVTLDPSFQREVEGTGLGLGIVRRLAGLMGGWVTVDSQPGEGSCFTVRLPLPEQAPEPQAPAAPEAPAPAAPAQLEVLVVEDNQINRMVVGEMLASRNCRVVEACDGQEGVIEAGRQRFDLILMDISMPRMDGVTAARAIRREGPNTDTPIIALTAHALPADQANFAQAGMEATLTKPLSFKALDDILRRFANKADAAAPPPAKPRTGPDRREAARAHLAESIGPERAAQVVDRILAELDDGLARLRDMIQDPALNEDVARLAHRMAGSVALIGFDDIRDSLNRLETRARGAQSPDRAGLAAHLAELEAMAPANGSEAHP